MDDMRGPNQKRIPIARKLRRDSTSAESKLWAELRNRQLGGFKFVRQAPIGKYIADFVCREALLVVEVDGATHSTTAEVTRDESRTSFLKGLGYRIVRIQNDDVYNAMEGVLRTIGEALQSSGMS
jgi:very-short-patch-repair endonuclease